MVLVSFPSTGGRAAAWAAARRRSLRWCRSPVSVDRRAAVADRGRRVVSGEMTEKAGRHQLVSRGRGIEVERAGLAASSAGPWRVASPAIFNL